MYCFHKRRPQKASTKGVHKRSPQKAFATAFTNRIHNRIHKPRSQTAFANRVHKPRSQTAITNRDHKTRSQGVLGVMSFAVAMYITREHHMNITQMMSVETKGTKRSTSRSIQSGKNLKSPLHRSPLRHVRVSVSLVCRALGVGATSPRPEDDQVTSGIR